MIWYQKAHCQTAPCLTFLQKTLLCVTTVLCCLDLSAVGAFVTPTPKHIVTVSLQIWSDSDIIAEGDVG